MTLRIALSALAASWLLAGCGAPRVLSCAAARGDELQGWTRDDVRLESPDLGLTVWAEPGVSAVSFEPTPEGALAVRWACIDGATHELLVERRGDGLFDPRLQRPIQGGREALLLRRGGAVELAGAERVAAELRLHTARPFLGLWVGDDGVVHEVTPESPAARAGLRVEDEVEVFVDPASGGRTELRAREAGRARAQGLGDTRWTPVNDPGSVALLEALARKLPGEALEVHVKRGAERFVARVTLGERPPRTY